MYRIWKFMEEYNESEGSMVDGRSIEGGSMVDGGKSMKGGSMEDGGRSMKDRNVVWCTKRGCCIDIGERLQTYMLIILEHQIHQINTKHEWVLNIDNLQLILADKDGAPIFQIQTNFYRVRVESPSKLESQVGKIFHF